jgi:hypothetical protein
MVPAGAAEAPTVCLPSGLPRILGRLGSHTSTDAARHCIRLESLTNAAYQRDYSISIGRRILERMMIKQMTRGFPVVLLAAWMTMAVLTLNSFIGFSAVTHH